MIFASVVLILQSSIFLRSSAELVTDGDVEDRAFVSEFAEKSFVEVDLGAVKRVWGVGIHIRKRRFAHLRSMEKDLVIKVSLYVKF